MADAATEEGPHGGGEALTPEEFTVSGWDPGDEPEAVGADPAEAAAPVVEFVPEPVVVEEVVVAPAAAVEAAAPIEPPTVPAFRANPEDEEDEDLTATRREDEQFLTKPLIPHAAVKPSVSVPEFVPAAGPIWLLVFADYPGSGALMTGVPFWGDGQVGRMVCSALQRNGYCDELTLDLAQKSAVDLAQSKERPNFQRVALTYIHSEVREGRTCSIEEVASKRNLDRIRNLLNTATARCPGPLHIVTLGSIAKFVLRGVLYGGTWDVGIHSLQSPSIGVGKAQFDEEAWINWAKVAMQTGYTL
jgi:hypothetical protein